MRALLFLSTMSAFFQEGLPFVTQPSVRPGPITRASWTKVRGRSLTVSRTAKERVEEERRISMNTGDVCVGGLPTPGWVRLAQRNLKRIKVGDKLPDIEVRRLDNNGVQQSFSIRKMFEDKRGVLVGVPGAFTPTCSQVHLPGYVDKSEELATKGADLVAFVAVNDVYVMRAWEDAQADGKVIMLADGNGDLAAALGMMMDLTQQGMGLRCKRFVCVVDRGFVTYMKVGDKATGPVSASSVSRALDRKNEKGARSVGLIEKLYGIEAEARAADAAEEREDLLPA